MDILDNPSQISERDSHNALAVAGEEPNQLNTELRLENTPSKIPRFEQIVVAGMGGSALASEVARDWLDLPVPFQVVKDYNLPQYVGPETLFVACSFSGNTEETISALLEAQDRGAPTIILTGGGELLKLAKEQSLPHVEISYSGQPRMNMLLNLRAFVEVFISYGLLEKSIRDELTSTAERNSKLAEDWGSDKEFASNLAKQLAWHCAGKTPIIYATDRFGSLAYKWKISFNENSKNIAFCNEFPEFNHNEFIGWSSHPVEKPFAVLDLRSSFDHPQVTKRFVVSDRLLSGKRPKALSVQLVGETMLDQFVWGAVLADYTSIYLAILNGVDPTPVDLIEKLKKDLVNP